MYTFKEKHDPFADGRRILEEAEQWKKDNPTPLKSADIESTEKRKKAAFTKKKGPALRKGVKVIRWNGIDHDEGTIVKKSKEYLLVDWDGTEEKIEMAQFSYRVKYVDCVAHWNWYAPANEAVLELVTKIEGDWERTYDHTGKCVSVRSLMTPWFLKDVHEFLTEQGYTVTNDEAVSLQDINEHNWVGTYYWFWGTCHDRKTLGAEVIKWMVGPLKEVVGDRLALKHSLLSFFAHDFGKLVAAVVDKKITPTMGKEVLTRMYLREDVDEILKDDKYKVSSGDDMVEFVRKVIEANPEQVADLKDGKDKILGWLVGQVMKESRGKANAGEVNKMFREELGL